MWREIYKNERLVTSIERRLNQPLQQEQIWHGALWSQVLDVLGDLTDETKALLTVLAFHIFGLVLIVIFNLIWFAFLFWVIGRWLDG